MYFEEVALSNFIQFSSYFVFFEKLVTSIWFWQLYQFKICLCGLVHTLGSGRMLLPVLDLVVKSTRTLQAQWPCASKEDGAAAGSRAESGSARRGIGGNQHYVLLGPISLSQTSR